MSSTPMLEIQTAVYNRLISGAAAITQSVYNDVPQNAQYPYIMIGEWIEHDRSSKGEQGSGGTLTLHGFDNQGSNVRLVNMMNEAMNSITFTNSSDANHLVFTSYNNSGQFKGMFQIIMDIDGETRHAILEIEFLLKEN